MRALALLPLVLLVACGTPQEQCIARAGTDLRTLDALIAETEGNIARGYAIRTETREQPYMTICSSRDKDGNIRSEACWAGRPVTTEKAEAIDLDAEAAKLASMKRKRADLAQGYSAAVAACRASYPE